ncbi:MAG: acetylornithine transaminase [bacterium]|nr:acetylornithine transaminase [bacterium]
MTDALMTTYAQRDEVFVRGQGARVTDANGREYLDFLAGIAVSALGHAHPAVVAAVQDQIGSVAHLSNLFRHPYAESVAARLCGYAAMDAVFFTNSGTESIECALKIARKVMHARGESERRGFLALHDGFHGRSFGALSLTHAEKYRAPFAPLLTTHWVPAGDRAALATALRKHRPAALVLEPIQGEGGIRPLSTAFLQAARELCDATDTLLIHDEIQSGCGRTGRFLAAQHADVTPDIVTLAKPLAAGLPMGACLARGEAARALQPGDHGSTFAGGPLVCRTALAFFDALDAGLQDNVGARGNELRAGLDALATELEIVTEVRGRGLMLGLELRHSAPLAQSRLYDRGLILNCTAGNVLRFLPPFVIDADDVRQCLDHVGAVLRELPSEPPPPKN